MMERKKYAVMIFCAILTLASAAAIIQFSGQDSGRSQALSKGITAWLLSLLSMEGTAENLELLNFILRKLAHFGLYYLLGFGLIGLVHTQKRGLAVLAVIVLGGLFAVSDEFHQQFSQGRSTSVWDVLLDTCGVTSGCVMHQGLRWLKERWSMGR